MKAVASCFLKSSGLSVSLAFQSADLQTAASEFGLVELQVKTGEIGICGLVRTGTVAGRRAPRESV